MSPTAVDVGALHARLARELRARFQRRGVPAQDVDDLVQDTLLRAHRARGSLRRGERADAWLLRIAHNVLVDAKRRGRFVPAPGADLDPPAETREPSTAQVAASWLPPAIDALPPAYRDVLRLADLEGVPHREIARRLGIGVSAVKSRVSRGRQRLREVIEACCAFERDRRGGLVAYRRRGPGDCAC